MSDIKWLIVYTTVLCKGPSTTDVFSEKKEESKKMAFLGNFQGKIVLRREQRVEKDI